MLNGGERLQLASHWTAEHRPGTPCACAFRGHKCQQIRACARQMLFCTNFQRSLRRPAQDLGKLPYVRLELTRPRLQHLPFQLRMLVDCIDRIQGGLKSSNNLADVHWDRSRSCIAVSRRCRTHCTVGSVDAEVVPSLLEIRDNPKSLLQA